MLSKGTQSECQEDIGWRADQTGNQAISRGGATEEERRTTHDAVLSGKDRREILKKSRCRKRKAMDFANYSIPKSFASKHVPVAHKVEYNATGLHSTKGGYKGVNQVRCRHEIPTVEALRKDGFKVIEWDGM